MCAKVAWVWAPHPYPKNFWLEERRDSLQYTVEELAKEHDILFLASVKKEPQKIGWMHLYVNPNEAFTALRKFNPDVINLGLFGSGFNRDVAMEFKSSLITLYDHGGDLVCSFSDHVDIFFTAQKYRRSLIIQRNKVPPERVILNPYGVNPKQFYPDDSVEKTYTGIMVGDFRKRKQQHIIIVNWSKVMDGKLLLIGRTYPPLGDPGYARRCRRLIEQLNLSERVKIQDFVPHDELPKIINSAEIGIHVAQGGSATRAVTEMMACGLPMIVLNKYRSNVEWVKDGGLKVEPDSIGTAVNYLKNNPAKYKELREAALRTIKPYTYDRMLATFRDVIEEQKKI